MAKAHELAEKDYILGMKYREIAEKYNVTIDAVKQWKKRYGWERDKPVRSAQKPVHNVPKKEKGYKRVQNEPEPEEELTDKEQLFCYYIVKTHGNATQAALKSGYSQNKACAQVQGSRLLRRPRVRQEIDRIKQLIRESLLVDTQVDIQDLLEFCLKIIYTDIGDYVAWGQRQRQVIGMYGPLVDKKTNEPIMETVNFVDLEQSEMLDTSVIQEVKQGKDGISIKIADKKWAWEQIIKYRDWLPDQHKRRIEEEKLKLSKAKLLLDVEKAKGENKENQHVDALRKKMSERKMKNGSS